MHAAFQLPFSGRCSRQVYGTVTSPKECGSVLNSRWVSIAWRQKERLWSWLCLWQIGDNVTCPWEIYGDAKYTFQDPFNHQGSSNTISSPDSSPVISHYLSLVACGVWWEGGKWGRQMTVFHSSPFPSFPAPAVRYVRRLLGTSQYHQSDLFWGAFLLGTIVTSWPYLHLG